MLGAEERGVRRTGGYAAATSEEGNDAEGKNHKPAKTAEGKHRSENGGAHKRQ